MEFRFLSNWAPQKCTKIIKTCGGLKCAYVYKQGQVVQDTTVHVINEKSRTEQQQQWSKRNRSFQSAARTPNSRNSSFQVQHYALSPIETFSKVCTVQFFGYFLQQRSHYKPCAKLKAWKWRRPCCFWLWWVWAELCIMARKLGILPIDSITSKEKCML